MPIIRRTRAAGIAAVLTTILAVPVGAEPAVPQSYPRAGFNSLVSIATDGTQGDATSADAQITPDGRYIAFFSDASTLVTDDDNGWGDVFLRDRVAGTTERISVAADGGDSDQMSMQPAISADGRYVAFLSYATNLTNETGLSGLVAESYLRDRVTGTTQRISRGLDGGPTSAGALGTSMSSDGRYVAFHSASTNLVPGDANAKADIFVWDSTDGSLRRVSVPQGGGETDGGSFHPTLSPDGRYVGFRSAATNLVEDDENSVADIFLADLQSGAIELISIASDGTQGNEDAFSVGVSISDDARFIAFQSLASNLVPNDTNGAVNVNSGTDIFVRDRELQRTERVSLTSSGMEMVNALAPSITPDGRYVAFTSIKPGEDPSQSFTTPADVWLHDRETGSTELISATTAGNPSDGEAEGPAVTADGRYVFFQTGGGLFVPGDANETTDVVVRDRVTDFGIIGLGLKGPSRDRMLVGSAAFPGLVLAEVDDPLDVTSSLPLGTDLTGARVSFRRTTADLLFRLDLDDLPSTAVKPPSQVVSGAPAVGASGIPGVTYGVRFTLGADVIELRATKIGTSTTPPSTPSFTLHFCDNTCSTTGIPLEGGYGTAGDEIRIAIPAGQLGLQPDEVLQDVTAFSSFDSPVGGAAAADEIALPDLSLPDTTIQVGLADPETQAEGVAFDIAESFGGQFGFPLTDLPWTGKALWARACIADVCSSGFKLAQ